MGILLAAGGMVELVNTLLPWVPYMKAFSIIAAVLVAYYIVKG